MLSLPVGFVYIPVKCLFAVSEMLTPIYMSRTVMSDSRKKEKSFQIYLELIKENDD